jgi:hypothetical protein
MELLNLPDYVLFLILVWTLPWKGVALWKSAKNGHKKWFIVMLVLNTVALLEIVYIFYFANKKAGGNKPQNNSIT